MWIDDKTWIELFKLVPRVTVEAMILNEKGEVLLVKRDVEPYKGKWHFPGGYVRVHEKLEDAVKRKAKEETGLTVEVVDFFRVYDYADNSRLHHPQGRIISIAYLCKPLQGKLKNNVNFFSFSNSPKKLGFGQEVYLEDLHHIVVKNKRAQSGYDK